MPIRVFIYCYFLPSPTTWTHSIGNAAHVAVQEAEASHVLIMRLWSLQSTFSTSMLCKEKAIFISCHVLPSPASWACTHAINNAAHVSVQEAEASHLLIMRLCGLPPTFSTSMLCKERLETHQHIGPETILKMLLQSMCMEQMVLFKCA